MTRIFNRLDESVSSKQAEGLRKAEDGFREIRVIRALKKESAYAPASSPPSSSSANLPLS